MDEKTGEYGGFSTWESKEAADAAAAKVQPVIKEKVGSLMKSPPAPALYEVYEAKA